VDGGREAHSMMIYDILLTVDSRHTSSLLPLKKKK
jgi:hypothetical protein